MPRGFSIYLFKYFAKVTPYLEKKLSDEKAARLRAIGYTPYGGDKKKGWW